MDKLSILYWLGMGLIVCLITLAVIRDRESKREAKKMDELTKLNRGNMDKPDWVKQPWQHEPNSKTGSPHNRGD